MQCFCPLCWFYSTYCHSDTQINCHLELILTVLKHHHREYLLFHEPSFYLYHRRTFKVEVVLTNGAPGEIGKVAECNFFRTKPCSGNDSLFAIVYLNYKTIIRSQ